MPRHSKLQLQILNLYKQFLRVTKDKPGFNGYIKQEFRRNSKIPKTDVIQIEYILRRGQRKLEMFKNTSVTGMGVFEQEETDSKQ